MKKKVIVVFLSCLVLMQTAFAANIETGQYETRSNIEMENTSETVEEQTYAAAYGVATVLIAAFAAGYQIGKDLAGGYQDDLETPENSNYDELDFAKFDAE